MKVGSYIHYRYENYLRYGLRVKDGSPPNLTKIFNDQREAIIQNAREQLKDRDRSQIKTQLEKQLNFFFNPESSGVINVGYATAEQVAELQKIIEQSCDKIIQNLSKNSGNVEKNYKNLEAFNIKNIDLGDSEAFFKQRRKNKIGGKNFEKQFTTLKAVYETVKELVKLRNRLSNSLTKSQADINFINEMNNFEKTYDILIDAIEENFESVKGNFKISDLSLNKGTNDFVKAIQSLVDMTRRTTNSEIEGYMGEYVAAASARVYQMVEEKGIENCLNLLKNNQNVFIDLLNKDVVGNNLSRKATSKENFIEDTTDKSKYETDTKLGGVEAHTQYTKDKVDVHFDLPGGQVNASIKNINLRRGKINVLDGSSTANLIQDYHTFANHYLNITANIGRPDSPDASTLMAAHNTFKLTLALHAIMGGVVVQNQGASELSRSEKADILIVNDNSKAGQYKVYFVSDIIDNIIKNLSLVKIENFKDPTQYANEWLGEEKKNNMKAGFARASKILAQLHTQQLKISISTNALI